LKSKFIFNLFFNLMLSNLALGINQIVLAKLRLGSFKINLQHAAFILLSIFLKSNQCEHRVTWEFSI